MPPAFDVSDLIAAMREALVLAGDDGLTTREIATRTPCTIDTADYIIRQKCLAGEMEYAGRKVVVNRAGMRQAIPAYRMTKSRGQEASR